MEAQARGKVIVVGEHAVVYGVPAIAAGIDRGARASARPASAGASSLEVRLAEGEPIRVDENEEAEPLGRAFGALMASARKKREVGALDVMVSTDLPAGAGLGCSAALGVAVARAVCGAVTDDEAREHAMAWERVFHGNPSGIDAAVAALGGTLLYRRTDGESVLEPIAGRAPLVFAVGHSGSASSTKTMVDSVARQRAAQPAVTQKTFDAIDAVVRNARLAIEAGDVRALGKLLDLNQMLLAGLLLSTQEIESMCDAARESGALGAKLTGAGGGGCVIALTEARADAERVLRAWSELGRTGFVAEVQS